MYRNDEIKSAKNKPQSVHVVKMTDICSAEHYMENGKYIPVLRNISLEVLSGEAVGIVTNEKDESKLLLEIIANVRPYYSGKCVLADKGMMQKKRVILPHLFYIDTPGMLYNNMTVLEFLMFATAKSIVRPIQRQKKILEELVEFDMDHIAFSQISSLTDSDKLLIELVTASLSDSQLVIFNVIDYDFSDRQIASISKICRYINVRGSVVIGSSQAKLIGVCCDKVAYVLGGTIEYFGTVEELCRTWDKVLYLVSDSNSKDVADKLRILYDKYDYVVSGNNILVYNFSDERITDNEFFSILFENGITPDSIKINKGRVSNSFEELIRLHDLQE